MNGNSTVLSFMIMSFRYKYQNCSDFTTLVQNFVYITILAKAYFDGAERGNSKTESDHANVA